MIITGQEEHEGRVIREARRLMAKIEAEALRGTPVHSHPDHPWILADGYPAEYAALADALDELDRLEKLEAERWETERMHRENMAAIAADLAGGFDRWLPWQDGRQDPVGDLAREARRDDRWPTQPEAPGLPELHQHLAEMGAPDEAHAALDSAWSEWQEGRRVCR
jgi:hypothetical protein